MSVKQEANGRRSVQVEVEVPGTPEEVWQAIARNRVPFATAGDGSVVVRSTSAKRRRPVKRK